MGDPVLLTVRLAPEVIEWLGEVATEQGGDLVASAEWAIEQQREAWEGQGQQDGPAGEEPV